MTRISNVFPRSETVHIIMADGVEDLHSSREQRCPACQVAKAFRGYYTYSPFFTISNRVLLSVINTGRYAFCD